MTRSEFLAWEELQPLKHEFDGLAPVAMAGGTAAHSAIQRNLAIANWRAAPGSHLPIPWQRSEDRGRRQHPLPGRLRRLLAPSPRAAPSSATPVVIFEVLSESTAQTDIPKNQEYAATASVRRYVALSQHRIGGTLFERLEGDWVGHLLGADAVLLMPEIGIEVPISEFYEGVTSVAQAGEPAQRSGP